MIDLKIDPEFEGLCPELTDEEFRLLKESILSEGVVLMPIVIWGDIIIDGHNRYKIILERPEIKFTTYEKDFENRYFAKAWICCNQLGRRNLSPQNRKYLIAMRYEAEKMASSFRGNQHTKSNSNDPIASGNDKICHYQNMTTRERIANESGVSIGYVQTATDYAKGVDAAEKIAPGIKSELLSGEIKVSEAEVAAIAKAPEEERRKRVEELRKPRDKPKKDDKNAEQKKRSIVDERRKKAAEADLLETIYGAMLAPPEAVSDESLLETLDGIANTLINNCNAMFEDFPQLMEDESIWKRVLSVLRPAKDYINQLERKEHQ